MTVRSSAPTWNGERSAAAHLVGHRARGPVVRDALGDDRELVAAEPGDGVAAAHDAAEALADTDEERVAGVVAVRVVDRLEAVEVEEHDRERDLTDDRERLVQLVLEQEPVAQPGQRIVERLVDEVVFGGAALGDVLGLGDEVRRSAVVVFDHAGRQQRPERVAVGGDEAQLDPEAAGAAVAQLAELALELLGVLGVGEREQVRRPHDLRFETEHAARPGFASRTPPSSSTMAMPIGAWVNAAWKRATASRPVASASLRPEMSSTCSTSRGPCVPSACTSDASSSTQTAWPSAWRSRTSRWKPSTAASSAASGELLGGTDVVGVDEIAEQRAGQPDRLVAQRRRERAVDLEQPAVGIDERLADRVRPRTRSGTAARPRSALARAGGDR